MRIATRAALAACVAGLACAPPVTAPLPIPAPAPRPRDPRAPTAPPPHATATATATAPGVCIPDDDRTTVSRLESDPHTVRACFVAPGDDERCVAIRRRDGAITPWTPTAPPTPTRRLGPTVKAARASFEVCDDHDRCRTVWVREASNDEPLTVDVDEAGNLAVVVLPRASEHDPLTFGIYDVKRKARTGTVALTDGFACGDGFAIDGFAVIATQECDAHDGHAFIADHRGTLVARVGDLRDLNTYDASLVAFVKGWGVLAPWARALVVVNGADPTRQLVIDLAPIVAHATDAPSFELEPDTGLDWLVASSTGGVGVFAPDEPDLRASWLVPTCAAPATSP